MKMATVTYFLKPAKTHFEVLLSKPENNFK